MTAADMLAAVRLWPPSRDIDWEERAAIREYDGGYPREEAERLAFGDVTRDCDLPDGCGL